MCVLCKAGIGDVLCAHKWTCCIGKNETDVLFVDAGAKQSQHLVFIQPTYFITFTFLLLRETLLRILFIIITIIINTIIIDVVDIVVVIVAQAQSVITAGHQVAVELML